MKKFFILALAVVGMLASCSKDDNTSTNNNQEDTTGSSGSTTTIVLTTNTLVGVWDAKEMILPDGTRVILNDNCISQNRMVFTENAITYVGYTYDTNSGVCIYHEPGTFYYKVSGNNILVSDDGIDYHTYSVTTPYSMRFSNNVLFFTLPNGTLVFQKR